MTEQIILLTLMTLLGFGLGILFFQGLWLTLQALPTNKQWGLRIFVSFIVRVSLVAIAFFYLMDHDWKRMLALATGFWVARYLVVQRIKINPKKSRTSVI